MTVKGVLYSRSLGFFQSSRIRYLNAFAAFADPVLTEEHPNLVAARRATHFQSGERQCGIDALSSGSATLASCEEVSSPHGFRAEQLPCPEVTLARATVRATEACPIELGCTLDPSSRVFSPTLTDSRSQDALRRSHVLNQTNPDCEA